MKIVSQLSGAPSREDTKPAPVTKSTSTFQGALTFASTKSSYTAGTASDSGKSKAPENKKKHVVSDTSVSDSGVPAVPASIPQVHDEAATAVIIKGVLAEAAGQASGDSRDTNATAATSAIEPGATLPLLASNFSPMQLSDNVASINDGDPKATKGTLASAAASTAPFDLAPAGINQQGDSTSATAQSKQLAAAGSLPVAASAMKSPALQAPATNASAQEAEVSPNAVASVSTADASTLAIQQTAPAFSQSVAATTSVTSLTSVPELQSASIAKPGGSLDGVTVSSVTKDALPRQAPSTAKGKSITTSLEPRDRLADDKEADAEATSSPQTIVSFVKVLDATENTTHVSGASSNSLDAAALQQPMQAILPSASDHMSQTPLSTGAPAETMLQSASTRASSEGQAMEGVTSAQLTQSMRSSEMKLGMQSAEFGNISISTSLNHQTISAQISVDHSELGKALATHLPAIEEKLGSAYGVQARVELRESHNPSSSSNSGYSNSGQQSRDQRQSERGASTTTQGAMFEQTASRSNFVATPMVAGALRLDIRI